MALKPYEQKYDEFVKEDEISKDSSEKAKVSHYMDRAQSDLFLARLLMKISTNTAYKQSLQIDSNYASFHWVIIISYYAMYHAATAAIAQKSLKARSHVATVAALAKHYALGSKLAQQLEEIYIIHLDATRITRTIAQYEVTKSFSEKEAQRIIDTAQEFMDKIREVIS